MNRRSFLTAITSTLAFLGFTRTVKAAPPAKKNLSDIWKLTAKQIAFFEDKSQRVVYGSGFSMRYQHGKWFKGTIRG